jgi:hypothetical protein
MDDGSWFLYRSPYGGPSAALVRRLPDRTPLAWFQRVWATTADAGRTGDQVQRYRLVEAHLAAELGADVPELTMLFTAGWGSNPPPGLDRDGPLPADTWEELRDLLWRCLRLEGAKDDLVHVDRHSVRVRTDDGEDVPGMACCFFLDDALVRAAPGRVAYLMLGDWRLAATTEPGRSGFEAPFPVRTLLERRSGAGTTWAVMLDTSWELGDTPPVAFAGVRLPELAQLLRTAVAPDPKARRRFRDRWSSWPWEPLALRALVAPGDRGIGAALRRYNRVAWRLGAEASVEELRRSAGEPHAAARARMARCIRELPRDQWSEESWRDPALSRIRATRHLVQATIQMSQHLAHQRWYLFDDLWAAAHPDLAASLLRCAAGWDPFRD